MSTMYHMPAAYQENLNYGHFETWTERPTKDMLQVKQVHGTDIATPETIPCEADGLVVSWEDFSSPLAIKTADCMPIVIEGEKGIVFLHAGWRGLAQGILKRPETSLIAPQRVFIGPCIHKCCFKVSEDFQENFKRSPNFIRLEGKLYFDLPQEAKKILREVFIGLRVEIAPVCTCCNPVYNSYRRNQTTERNWNLYIKG